MKKITIIALAVTLLTACSKENTEMNPGSSGTTPNSQKVLQTRVFSATISAAADPTSPPTSCSGVVPFAAPDFILNGNGIHLGQLGQTSSLHHLACDVSTTTGLLTTNVDGQIAAANGDLIYYEGDDVVNVAALLTQTGSTGAITGTWNITGGTGRFEGATGTLTIDGIVDFATFTFNCECVGTITY